MTSCIDRRPSCKPLRGALALFAWVALALLCACSRPDQAAKTIPAPAQANPYAEGASATAADLTVADLHERLRKHHPGQWEIQRYNIPQNTPWPALQAHYQNALGAAWQRDDRYRQDAGVGYRSAVWSNGKQAMAIALAPARKPDKNNVLTVFTPKIHGN